MNNQLNTKNDNHNEIDSTTPDQQFGYTSLIARVILESINDLGIDAIEDEGTRYWIDEATDVNIEALRIAIGNMPTKNGKTDAKPAIRHIMEQLDAREQVERDLVDIEIQFEQVPLSEIEEPTIAELAKIEPVAELLEWDDDWQPDWIKAEK